MVLNSNIIDSKKQKVALLMIGSELLDGRVLDTNKQYLSKHFADLGIEVDLAVTCRDDLQEIKDALSFSLKRAGFVVCSGGLGPTSDDLTREAVAEFLGVELTINEDVLDWLKDLYAKRKREFDPANIKQALFPLGAAIIPNLVGTAAGFQVTVSSGTAKIYALPGVPRELKPMLESSVSPDIISELKEFVKLVPRYLRIFGLPESVVGRKISELNLSEDIFVSYLASFPEVKVTLKSRRDLSAEIEKIKATIGEEFVFAEDFTSTLDLVVHNLLIAHHKTVAVAESCSGGMLGSFLTNSGGSSQFFLGGVISYSNEVKVNQLGVDRSLIEADGAVSHKVASRMACGVRERFHSSIGVSITGIAGPDGGSPAKPVGSFFIGLSSEKGSRSYKCFFSGTRDLIRRYSVYKALDLLRRELLEQPDPHDCETVIDLDLA